MRVISNVLSAVKLKVNPESVKPKSVGLLITGNCCLKCRTCTYWHKRKKDLTLSEVKVLVDKCVEFGIKGICLTGGEPLMRKDVTQIADYVKSKGLGVSMITNAWLLTPEIAEHFDDITVSIDGACEETHDGIRGVSGSWKRCIKALEYLKVSRINFVAQRDNYMEIKDLCVIAEEYGKALTVFFYCDSGSLGQSKDKSLREMDLVELKEQLRYAKKLWVRNSKYYDYCHDKLVKGVKKQSCVSIHFQLMIDEVGNVYPCSHFNHSVGNLLKQSFQEVWESYSVLRAVLRRGGYPHCLDCYSPELNCNFVMNFRDYSKLLSITMVDELGKKVKELQP